MSGKKGNRAAQKDAQIRARDFVRKQSKKLDQIPNDNTLHAPVSITQT